MSSQALSNTLVSPETAFSAKKRSVQTKSPSSFTTALVITLTLALVLSIACVGNPLTFTSSFGVFAVYACSVLCLDLIDLTLAVRTSACVCTSTLLKSSFVKAREHASKSCSLIVTSCFITLSKTAFVSVASLIMSRYCFLGVLCLLRTSRLSFTFTRTASFVGFWALTSMSLSATFVTVASFYSLVRIVFRTTNLCFVGLVLFRIFVGFLHFLSFARVRSIWAAAV